MLQLTAVMSYLPAAAKGMTVAPVILVRPLLNPVHVAKDAATRAVLSGGHDGLGVGLGHRAGEFTSFGVPLAERAPRLEEGIGLIRRLWAAAWVTHRRRF